MIKLPLSFKPKKISNTFLTLDIGSSSIKVLAIKHMEDHFEILAVTEELLEQGIVRAGHIINKDIVINKLHNALNQVSYNMDEQINDVIIGLGGDLCTCLTTTVRVNRGKNDEITQKEVDDITNKVLEAAIDQTQQNILAKTGNDDIDIQIITTTNVYTKLDGKIQNDLIGKQGTKIEIATFTASVPTYHLDILEEISHELNLNILAITPNIYALSEMLKNTKGEEALDAILIDVGGDTTGVAIIFGGGIVSSQVLNIGGIHFSQQLSTGLGVNFSEAEKKKLEYAFNMLDDSQSIHIENVLDYVGNIWLDGLETLFSEFTGIKTFPSNIYLTGGGFVLPILLENMESKPWTKSIPFKELPNFNKINISDFNPIISDTTGKADELKYMNAITLALVFKELNN